MIEALAVDRIQVDAEGRFRLNEQYVREWEHFHETGDWNVLTPEAIFADLTYIGPDRRLAIQIQRRCLADKHIPLIDHDRELGWIFHTLFGPNGTVSKKAIAERFEDVHKTDTRLVDRRKSKRATETEYAIEQQLVHYLRRKGDCPQRQMHCGAGYADVVTATAIYEVKRELNQAGIREAISQVLLYRQAIDPGLDPWIVGVRDRKMVHQYDLVRQLGIGLLFWDRKGRQFYGD